MIEDFFSTGRAADVVMAALVFEALWLRTRGWSVRSLLAMLGPAVCFVLALRAALTGADWWWIAIALAASLPFHLIDLRGRIERRQGVPKE